MYIKMTRRASFTLSCLYVIINLERLKSLLNLVASYLVQSISELLKAASSPIKDCINYHIGMAAVWLPSVYRSGIQIVDVTYMYFHYRCVALIVRTPLKVISEYFLLAIIYCFNSLASRWCYYNVNYAFWVKFNWTEQSLLYSTYYDCG